jgi:YVTN family beta-propeller protein
LTKDVPSASTRFAILGQLPKTLTLSGEAPFTTTYGMPQLYVYNGTATLVATETATSVSSDGSQATFPFPSSLTQSGYSVAVANQTSGSPGISTVGTNYLSIASSQTIAGNPFGVAAGSMSVTTKECHQQPGASNGTVCTSNEQTGYFPVVSLYSLNQVFLNGTAVNVGLNPTAIATYSSGTVQDTYDNGAVKLTYTGTTRGVVANSGGNNVSILDLIQKSVIYNVTVGNQPVALAVSSDGGTAYVANYKDSTVAQVNLKTGTATETISVGGKPTSVALTSAGILWAGGMGFLTEINTQTMSVVATEAVTGKSIIALGYSDAESELVATSVDSGGNVYEDEIAPGTFAAGGAYTPLASHTVSTLGAHLNAATNTNALAFSATLANANLINTNQVGAPPLVVQDGWAVVTATPTGFTITDVSGHVVLVSEKTPSPVTAIAVDTKLNVAYLVMPDSNILLTVPLPGTN